MSELPKGWVETALGELVEFQYGKSLPEKDRKPGPYLVYGSNGTVGTHEDAITEAPAIIVGRKGSIGEVHFSEARCFPIDTTYFIDDFRGNAPRFVERLLRLLPLTDLNRATAVPGLNREDAYALKVPLSPLAEQWRIVTKLDGMMARTARARADLDRIPRLIANYKKAFLAAAFSRNRIENEQVELGQLVEFVTSGSCGWAKYYSENGAVFVRVANVRRDRVSLDCTEIQHVKPPKGSEGERTRLKENDIVVTITADLGRVGIIPSNLGEAYVNQHVGLVRLTDPTQAPFIA